VTPKGDRRGGARWIIPKYVPKLLRGAPGCRRRSCGETSVTEMPNFSRFSAEDRHAALRATQPPYGVRPLGGTRHRMAVCATKVFVRRRLGCYGETAACMKGCSRLSATWPARQSAWWYVKRATRTRVSERSGRAVQPLALVTTCGKRCRMRCTWLLLLLAAPLARAQSPCADGAPPVCSDGTVAAPPGDGLPCASGAPSCADGTTLSAPGGDAPAGGGTSSGGTGSTTATGVARPSENRSHMSPFQCSLLTGV
jgi:hypothetical protein